MKEKGAQAKTKAISPIIQKSFHENNKIIKTNLSKTTNLWEENKGETVAIKNNYTQLKAKSLRRLRRKNFLCFEFGANKFIY